MPDARNSAWKVGLISPTTPHTRWLWRHCDFAATAPNRVIRCFNGLQHTIDLPNAQWRVPDQAHRKRNLAECEDDMDVDERLVAALLRVAREAANRVKGLVNS
jgi:hypothetical protein